MGGRDVPPAQEDEAMASAGETLVQYYLAERGRLGDGALALLAARGALLGHARWRARPGYARWHDRVMTKIVLAAPAEELARLRPALGEALALDGAGGAAAEEAAPALLVLPPQPRAVLAPLLGGLPLAAGMRGATPEPAGRPLLLVVADDLGMHGGKLAAQCAHAVLLAQAGYGRTAAWAAWVADDRPLALRRADSAGLAELGEHYPAGAVHDAGHTQVAAGALTAVALLPGATGPPSLLPW